MAKIIGIDLGTANTFICVKGKGIIKRAPSVISLDTQTGDVIAVGLDARKMIGKTPSTIKAIQPIRSGVIADCEITTLMLRQFLRQIDATSAFNRPIATVCVPYDITGVERRAVENAAYDAGLRDVMLIEEPLAAAIGAGLPVDTPRGSMIVDIGAGITEAAVISHGGIVVSHSLRIAGDDLDEAIIEYMRTEKGLLIGAATAESLKNRIGSVHSSVEVGVMTVFGRNLANGMADSAVVSTSELRHAMKKKVTLMIDVIEKTLEATPPELSADIFDRGMIITGGGSMLRGITKVIYERTRLRVVAAKNPLDCVCMGINRVIDGGTDKDE